MKIIRTATLALFVVAVLATPEDELIAEARRFTATLYQELIKSRPNQNVVFSAISVQTLMGLLASGSRNENDEAIREIVVGTNLPYGDANRQNAFKEVLKSLNTKDDDFNVIDATKIYIPKRYRIQNWYQHIAKSVYGTEIEAINFNNPENASQIMNHWVETKTNNTIKNLVKSGDLEDADMVLINTLYLNEFVMKIIRTATLALFVVAVLATPEDELIAEARRFTATLYQELIKSRPNQNVVFSAISVQTLMGLLASGSSNENDEAIREIVVGTNLPYGDANRQNAFKEVLKSLNTKDDDFNVIDATKIYIPKRYRIQNWYQHIAKSVYGTEIEAINFNNPENASQIMNHWVETKTNNTIKNLVKSGDLEDADMVLINTLYLNGNWMIQFSPERNIIKSFYSPNGIQQVTMMINEYQKQRYAEDNHAQYLSLEIASSFDRDGVAEMVFVLPKQKQPLSTLENNVYDLFRPVTFNECFVNVTLPKFSFSSDIPLIVPLKSIGIRKIFGYPGAKFDGLTPDVGAPYIRITNALQKASIDVNEMGVAASVATAYPYTPDAPACYKVFNADRPFLFYISVDDVILFAGRVMQI